jgi:hypothetical protein
MKALRESRVARPAVGPGKLSWSARYADRVPRFLGLGMPPFPEY